MGSAIAQHLVSGTVTSQSEGTGLPGVTVAEKGTTNGTVSDPNGKYSIKISSSNATLVFSFIGMTSQEIPVKGRTSINVALESSVHMVDDVVVTAMGMKRDTKSLGYAISKVTGDQLTVAGSTINPVVSLYGKAAGVGVTTGAAGPTGAVDIKIRGAAGLESSANTRPLFVVDGVPIYDKGSSMESRGYDPLNSFDYGSGINDINPEDIESMEILKGAKASVLYGSQGANGVVLITTKKGAKTRGLGVTVSTQHTWEKPHSYIDFQNEYGSGVNEYDMAYTTLNGKQVRDIVKSRYNFGPKFDGTQIMFLDSIVRPYQAYPNNYINLFKTGSSDNTTVAIAGGNEKGNMRLAYTNYDYQGVLDRFYQDKNVVSFTGSMNVSDFASFEVNSNLYSIKTQNRYPNIQDMVAWGINRDYPFDAIKGMYKTKTGEAFSSEGLGWPGQFAPSYLMGILWHQYEDTNIDDKFHYIGSARATLHFTDWLYFVGQAGIDYTNTDYTVKNPISRFYPQNSGGKYSYSRNNVTVEDYRGFLNFEKKFLDNKLNVLAFVGGEYTKSSYTDINVSSYGNFDYNNFWSIDNGSQWPGYSERGRVRGNDYGSKVMYSGMASATISWNNDYYLELQARNDWTSTLAPGNNSYFYPGVSFNWNFTNTFPIDFMKFGKFRMAWADVGRDAPGYYYAYQSYSVGTLANTQAQVVNGPETLFAGNIKPERKREFEIGFDTRFFEKKPLEADFSFYTNNVYDQIMGVDLSAVTGANSIKINAGNVKNWGYELFVKGALINNSKFRWELSGTAAIQNSKVKKLYPGITSKTIGSVGQSVVVTAKEGQPYGDINMYDYLTDGSGHRVVDDNGYYVLDKSKMKVFGNITDHVFGGLMSDFYFKGFNFHVGVDYKFGGNLFSYSNYYLLGMGITKETLKYRDEAHGGLAYYVDANGTKVAWQSNQAAPAASADGRVYHDGVITPGVVRSGGTDSNPVYTDNKKILSAAEYYSSYIHDMSQDFQPDNLYKNDYVKLRELSITYVIPKNIVNIAGIQKLSVSLNARNLFYFYKTIPNIDSESALGTGSFTEYSFFPSVKSYGFGLNVSF